MFSINYDKNDDILLIKLSSKKICREVSQDWNTHVSFSENGSVVEIVLLDFQQNFNNFSDDVEKLCNVKETMNLVKN